ncbi:hypothetical protein LCGC14_1773150 [marine sediment metagenome]|uniref:Uncharacterized protein n=1 Tax=marine sediment metagenome TaxID=412755 RepID=A0A0F9JCJ1_9ZZZZ
MNGITFQQIEDLNAEEAAQMQRYINNRLTAQRRARAERMIEVGLTEKEIEDEDADRRHNIANNTPGL